MLVRSDSVKFQECRFTPDLFIWLGWKSHAAHTLPFHQVTNETEKKKHHLNFIMCQRRQFGPALKKHLLIPAVGVCRRTELSLSNIQNLA